MNSSGSRHGKTKIDSTLRLRSWQNAGCVQANGLAPLFIFRVACACGCPRHKALVHKCGISYADAIRSAFGTAVGGSGRAVDLTQSEVLVLMCIAYFQPITRTELSSFFGKEISRDLIGHLRGAGLIASGPRSPTPGAPYTYVTTKEFLLESASTRYATCRISRRSRTPDCSQRKSCWRAT